MTPKEKAMLALGYEYDTAKVLQAMAERFPQVFLEQVSRYKEPKTITAVAPKAVVGPVTLDSYQQAHMLSYLDCGDVVPAIKHVRDVTGAGLRDAKDYVDQYRGKRPIQPPASKLNHFQRNEVKCYIRRGEVGDKVRAIKYIREQTRMGLKESIVEFDIVRKSM